MTTETGTPDAPDAPGSVDAADEDALAVAYERALALEKAGDAAAAGAWETVLSLNAADPGGAALRLAALGRGDDPSAAPPAYVATLFDQHAEVFDGILVDQLEYAVPMGLRGRLQALGLGPFARMLDLGCGTGLAAEALEDMTTRRTGVDLAEGMIEIAGEKELYDDLYVAEAVRFVETEETGDIGRTGWDLIVATDVLPYIGDARPLFAGVAARAAPGAIFAFSTETLPPGAFGARGWRVTPHHRFAHDPGWLVREAAAAGLELVERTDVVVRRENGAPIAGHLIVTRRVV